MKLQRHLSNKGKLSSADRDLLIFMPRKKLSMLSVGSAALEKCREFWRGLTSGGFAVVRRRHADDYFRGSYEFSCTATPINLPAKTTTNGRGWRRRLPPCVGGKQAQEMLERMAPGRGWSPERSPGPGAGNEIDGLAEEFIRRFYEQLRMQRVDELQVEHETRALRASPGSLCSSDVNGLYT
ncbi:hypothetical protein GQ55_1G243700 [Panicum hallii var. hallii]|uniref:Uncharacterized protein n=1 Tax=Panicum hallii var. hallii TaxID=1504633 RepID=A0A2T7F721_9POAL|nr:hypothetical protein GQ55_1G243700 [Panicum hallii var. hallii]